MVSSKPTIRKVHINIIVLRFLTSENGIVGYKKYTEGHDNAQAFQADMPIQKGIHTQNVVKIRIIPLNGIIYDNR
jgi:hypothetical protein